MTKLIQLIKIVFITLLILVVIELLSFGFNSYKKQAKPFLIDLTIFSLNNKDHEEVGQHGYQLVDPLLGWGITKSTLESRNLSSAFNCVVLQSSVGCQDPYSIFLTGGSTTDLIINPANWPVKLAKILEKKGLCADIYIGAIGGYSSGQEVLKLIRDGQDINIDLHISYSGANEFSSPDYVSRQEKSLYNKTFEGSQSYGIFPNTMAIFSSSKNKNLELYAQDNADPAAFWMQNMQIMQAINASNDASFIGILQPVLGIENQHQQNVIKDYNQYVSNNKSFYPALANELKKKDYLLDLSGLFDTSIEEVFKDDCHINDSYQEIVAEKIFEILEEKKFLPTKLSE